MEDKLGPYVGSEYLCLGDVYTHDSKRFFVCVGAAEWDSSRHIIPCVNIKYLDAEEGLCCAFPGPVGYFEQVTQCYMNNCLFLFNFFTHPNAQILARGLQSSDGESIQFIIESLLVQREMPVERHPEQV